MLVPALLCAALGGLGGWFVPALVRVVPEPELEPDEEPKELYADVARTAYLAPRSALGGAVVGGLIGWTLGWAWPLLYLLPAVPLGIALAVIDWRTRRLPTWYLAPAYPVLVVLLVACAVITRDWDDLARAGLGWAILGGGYVLSFVLSPSFGYGDVRLSGLLGLGLGYLGWPELVVGGFLAFPLFAVPPIVVAIARRDLSVLKARVPFGPAMLVSAAAGIVVGQPVADWYLSRSGMG